MTSFVDQLPQHPEGSPEGTVPEEDAVDASAGFDADFGDEIRSLFDVSNREGLFGTAVGAATPQTASFQAAPSAGTATAESSSQEPVGAGEPEESAAEAPATEQPRAEEAVVSNASTESVSAEATPDDEPDSAPQLFAAPAVSLPAKQPMQRTSGSLFLPRVESGPERAAPAITGLSIPAKTMPEPVAITNLFVSSETAPAEVAFVPAQEVQRDRYRWFLILLGLILTAGAIWLTWLAQSGETIDAPVTTIATVPTTLVETTEAPAETALTTASTLSSTTTAPTTTATTATTAASTVPATAAPVARPRPTTPRPAPTARPASTAPTTAVTIPDLDVAPPTHIPDAPATTAAPTPATTAAPADPPAED